MFQNPNYGHRRLQLEITNTCIQVHGLTCSCNNPGYHLLQILTEQIGKELKPEEKNQLKQCLGDQGTTAAGGEEDHIFGDLEELFEKDFTDADTG